MIVGLPNRKIEGYVNNTMEQLKAIHEQKAHRRFHHGNKIVAKVIGNHHPKNSKRMQRQSDLVDPCSLPQAGMKVWADVDIVHGPLGGALSVHENQDVIRDRLTRKDVLSVEDINDVPKKTPRKDNHESHFNNFRSHKMKRESEMSIHNSGA